METLVVILTCLFLPIEVTISFRFNVVLLIDLELGRHFFPPCSGADIIAPYYVNQVPKEPA